MAGWAPGGNNLELPSEAGFPEEKGTTHWVIQLHYNNAKNLAGQLDNSGYDLCTTDKLRPNDAGVVAFGSTKFGIPPRSTTTVKCDYKLPATFKDVKLFNASPHMHTRGTAMSTERLAGGTGAPVSIFANPNFNFENQANFPIKAQVAPGDVMRTRCTWKNAGDTTIAFGENTGDEMCFDFIGYYPNIPDRTIFGLPLFSWVTPSQSWWLKSPGTRKVRTLRTTLPSSRSNGNSGRLPYGGRVGPMVHRSRVSIPRENT